MDQAEASLFLTRDFSQDESINEEDIMYAYCTYIAENAESLNLVEGEKVFVIGKTNKNIFNFLLFKSIHLFFVLVAEKHNADWWFVKKPLTEERGWVPSQFLMDAESYTQYVQKKLNEKIDKLPVFESKLLFL